MAMSVDSVLSCWFHKIFSWKLPPGCKPKGGLTMYSTRSAPEQGRTTASGGYGVLTLFEHSSSRNICI